MWDERLGELGSHYDSAVVSLVAPDGFPFSVRVPITVDDDKRVVRLGAEPVGPPLQPGLACLAVHDHAEDFSWQRNFQVRGDLAEDEHGWFVVPHRLVGGFEMPPGSFVERYRLNAKKTARFRKIAKRELKQRKARAA